MAVNPKSIKNLRPDLATPFSKDNQPANRGRNALEFEIRKALLEGDRPRIAEIVSNLVGKAIGYEDSNGVTRIDYEAIKFLFEHGFSKPKSDLDITATGNVLIQIISPFEKPQQLPDGTTKNDQC